MATIMGRYQSMRIPKEFYPMVHTKDEMMMSQDHNNAQVYTFYTCIYNITIVQLSTGPIKYLFA